MLDRVLDLFFQRQKAKNSCPLKRHTTLSDLCLCECLIDTCLLGQDAE